MFKVTFSETYLVSFSECMVSLSFQIAHYLQSQMMLDFGGESECTFLLGKHSSFLWKQRKVQSNPIHPSLQLYSRTK